MAYRIKIEKVDYQMQEKRGSYTILRTQYLRADEYDQLSREEKKDWKRTADTADGSVQYESNIYGHPSYSESTEVTTKVYEQMVDALDMRAVINAVNQPPVLAVGQVVFGHVQGMEQSRKEAAQFSKDCAAKSEFNKPSHY